MTIASIWQYVEVPGGTHGSVVAPNLRAMFDFFDRYRKGGAAPSPAN